MDVCSQSIVQTSTYNSNKSLKTEKNYVQQLNALNHTDCYWVSCTVLGETDACGCGGGGLAGGLIDATLLCLCRIGLSYSSIDIVRVRSIL